MHWTKHSITNIYVEDTCNIVLQTFKSFQLQTCFFFLILYCPFLNSNFFWYTFNNLKNKTTFEGIFYSPIKKNNFYWSNALIYKNYEQGLKIYALFCKSLIDFNETFIPYNELQSLVWSSIVAHSPAGVMYIVYGLVILVHRNIKVTTLTIGCIQFRQGFEC